MSWHMSLADRLHPAFCIYNNRARCRHIIVCNTSIATGWSVDTLGVLGYYCFVLVARRVGRGIQDL